jgi:threonine dehydrogenase-like Zn-dependent dehydrogenase
MNARRIFCKMRLSMNAEGRLPICEPGKLITHRFSLNDVTNAYETFAQAADTQTLKVIIAA